MNMLMYENEDELIDELMEYNKDFLKKLRTSINKKVKLKVSEIEKTVLSILQLYIDEFNLPVDSPEGLLTTKSRLRQLSYGRNFYCWYIYINTPYSLDFMATATGGRHHATIIHNTRNYVISLSSNIYEHNFLEGHMNNFGLNINDYHVSKIKQHTQYIEDFDGNLKKRLTKNSLS